MVDPTEKDITELQELYAKRTQNAGRMYFGLQRTKQLKATLHWVQDFARVSEVPTLEGLTQESFKAAISIAAQRADIRKKEAKDTSSVSSEVSPGKLKDDKNVAGVDHGIREHAVNFARSEWCTSFVRHSRKGRGQTRRSQHVCAEMHRVCPFDWSSLRG